MCLRKWWSSVGIEMLLQTTTGVSVTAIVPRASEKVVGDRVHSSNEIFRSYLEEGRVAERP